MHGWSGEQRGGQACCAKRPWASTRSWAWSWASTRSWAWRSSAWQRQSAHDDVALSALVVVMWEETSRWHAYRRRDTTCKEGAALRSAFASASTRCENRENMPYCTTNDPSAQFLHAAPVTTPCNFHGAMDDILAVHANPMQSREWG